MIVPSRFSPHRANAPANSHRVAGACEKRPIGRLIAGPRRRGPEIRPSFSAIFHSAIRLAIRLGGPLFPHPLDGLFHRIFAFDSQK
jgi:hypothetical protein